MSTSYILNRSQVDSPINLFVVLMECRLVPAEFAHTHKQARDVDLIIVVGEIQ